MTPIEKVLSHFPDARRNGAGWMVRCPAHEDHTASLSVAEGRDEAVLLHCHAGCSVDAVVAAAGLSMSDLFPATEPKLITSTYDYLGADDALLYQVVSISRRTSGSGGPMARAAGSGA